MAYRFTDTDKWSDNWFIDLTPSEKLLFIYLCDNCDIGGFFEVSLKKLSFDLGINQRGLQGALKGLARGFVWSDDHSVLFLRNFLKHQKNTPLTPANKAHLGIIRRFQKYADRFDLDVLSEAVKIDLYHILDIKREDKPKEKVSPFKGATEGLKSPTGIGIGIDIDKDNSKGGTGGETVITDPEVIVPEDDFSNFIVWLKDHASNVARMTEPFTRDQYERLVEEYRDEDVKRIVEAMHNYKPLLTKCVSANLTARNWLRRDKTPLRSSIVTGTGSVPGSNSKIGKILNNLNDLINEQ